MNRKEFLVVLVVTFGVVMVWIVSDIIHSKSSFSADPKIKSILEEKVDPNFDKDALNQVNSAPTPAPTISATANPTPSPSSSASPKAASSSATPLKTSSPSATPR